MANVKIYTTMLCPFCYRAKALLNQKQIEFEEIDVTFSPAKRKIMTDLAGGRTSVPQIFIDENAIGGCDDLYALEQKGELDPLLTDRQ